MRKIMQRPLRRKKAPRTAAEEALAEAEQQGHEDDTDTSRGRERGPGDPITPSTRANREATGDDRSDRP
ncbi:hypothetical protein [Streptomyces sporangiiformans]|uniref:Uncharacterized protein n=1 Tax=Streptomyces sporangiiformans TaxID=2315329 RepID=A0A505DDU5_9ACTN|nr:hypothetical protein [Streptomyces sporangiiformans]TPQ18738.1 hypothetical protein FGD71_029700 [Streptomyces sporangiiformans]